MRCHVAWCGTDVSNELLPPSSGQTTALTPVRGRQGQQVHHVVCDVTLRGLEAIVLPRRGQAAGDAGCAAVYWRSIYFR